MYPLSTKPEEIHIEAVVAFACAQDSHVWNGNSALFTPIPTVIKHIATLRAVLYSPVWMRLATAFAISGMSNWPVIVYIIDIPIKNRPEPMEFMIKYLIVATIPLPVSFVIATAQAVISPISMKTYAVNTSLV